MNAKTAREVKSRNNSAYAKIRRAMARLRVARVAIDAAERALALAAVLSKKQRSRRHRISQRWHI